MDRNTKIIWIIVGGLVSIGAIGTAIYYLGIKPKNEREAAEKKRIEEKRSERNTRNENESTAVRVNKAQFNTEGELTTPMTLLKGKVLFPKPKMLGGQGATTVRSSAEVNLDQGWWDWGNEITKIGEGQEVGTVIGQEYSDLNGYAYRWIEVNISRLGKSQKTGFVRADTVYFKADGL